MRSIYLFLFILVTSPLYSQELNEKERGMEAFDRQEWEDAKSLFSQWIRGNTGDAEAYLLRGQSYQGMGDLVKANTDYSIAINLRPEHAESYFIRGRARYLMELYDGAIEDFAAYIKLPKGETNQIIYKRSPGEGGVSQIITAQSENPAEAFYHLGLCHFELAYYETAVYYYDMAIENNPRNPDYYSEKGRALGRFGENDLSIKAYQKALELDPGNALATLGLQEVNRGGSEDFLDDLNEAVESDYANSQTFKQRGFYRLNHGDSEGAIEDLNEALRLDPYDPETYYYRGRAFSNLENFEQSELDFSNAIRIDSKDHEFYLARGQSRYRKGELKEAMADFVMVVTIDPALATGYFHMGITNHRMNRLDLACQNLQKAEDLGMLQATDILEKICR